MLYREDGMGWSERVSSSVGQVARMGYGVLYGIGHSVSVWCAR